MDFLEARKPELSMKLALLATTVPKLGLLFQTHRQGARKAVADSPVLGKEHKTIACI
jgi:hypothetical protein